MGVLGAEAGEVVHGSATVGAVDPLAARPPVELGGLGRGGKGLPSAEQGLDVHAVVDERGRHQCSFGRIFGRSTDRKRVSWVTLLMSRSIDRPTTRRMTL